MGSINIVFIISELLGLGVVAYFVYRKLQNQPEKPKWWKAAVVTLVGIFSVDFKFFVADTPFAVPFIPLGVFLLFIVLSRTEKIWKTYRPFAWLGFKANFIFLAATLLAIPVHGLIYPKEAPSTYLAQVEHAYLLPIHPSAPQQTLHVEKLRQEIGLLEKSPHVEDWFEAYDKEEERFPYQLVGSRPKWGSGMVPAIYVERDGQGLLVVTPLQSYYFRAKESFLEGGAPHESTDD